MDIEETHKEFFMEVTTKASIGEDFSSAVMFELFEEVAVENGDIEGLHYSPFQKTGLQIDGYYHDEVTDMMTIAVSDFRISEELEKLNSDDIKTAFKRVGNFVKKAFSQNFLEELEISSQGYQVGEKLRAEKNKISRIKFILFSNANLVSRMTGMESENIDGIPCSYAVLDFGRYFEIINSKTGSEPITVDLEALGWDPLPMLPAASKTNEYQAYLVAMPGNLLGDIYQEFGPRLLEQNVRTFLQARGKVNKGIQTTLKERPEMFFAYNNGITATASEIEKGKNSDGEIGITKIENLQIVNGGQTTASMLYARDKAKTDLSKVYIQMKLSVIRENLEEVVPNISRFANTQNRVSEADFFSNHPFHIAIEEKSRRINAPAKEGHFGGSKWFYERARGQYRDGQAYLSNAERKSFLAEFPKNQMFTKTDLAKYHVSFQQVPYQVSKGAQFNFLAFAKEVAKTWSDSETHFSDDWFKHAVAKAIIFKGLDAMIPRSDWYEGGYKANVVTYSISWLIHNLEKKKMEIDFQKIWIKQGLTEELEKVFAIVSKAVYMKIQDTPPEMKNVTEWCKQQGCWNGVKDLELDVSEADLKKIAISREEAKQNLSDAKKIQKIDNEINAEQIIFNMGESQVIALKNFAKENKFLSPDGDRVLEKRKRDPLLTPGDNRVLIKLLKTAQSMGFTL